MVKASPPSAGGVGVTPGQEASWPKNQNIKQKQYCNKFHKDFKMIHIKKKKKKASETSQPPGSPPASRPHSSPADTSSLEEISPASLKQELK